MSPGDRQKYIAQFRENCPQLHADYENKFNECFKAISNLWDLYHDGVDVDPQDAEAIYFDLCELVEKTCTDFAHDGMQVVEFMHQGETVEAVQSAIDRAIASKDGDELTQGIARVVCTAAMEQAHNFENEWDFADEFADVLKQALVGDENYKRIKD